MAKNLAEKIVKSIANCQYSFHVILLSDQEVAIAYPAQLGLKESRKRVRTNADLDQSDVYELESEIIVGHRDVSKITIKLCEIGSPQEAEFLERGQLIEHG